MPANINIWGKANVDEWDKVTKKAAAMRQATVAAAGAMGTAMMVAGAAIAAGLVGIAIKAGEADLAHQKLVNTLANMPKLAGMSTYAFEAQATELQNLTAAEDDAVIAAQAMLGTFQVTADQMLGMMPLINDYARKFDTDLVTAAKQVGKALDGQIGSLKKNGVSIDAALYKTDRYAAVTQALRQQVGGFAEQELTMLPGALLHVQNQMEDLMEKAGKPLAGMLTDYANKVSKVVADVGGWIEQNPELSRSLADNAVGMTGSLLALGLLIKGLSLGAAAFAAIAAGSLAAVGGLIAFGSAVKLAADTMIAKGQAAFGTWIADVTGTRDAQDSMVRSIISTVPAARGMYETLLGAGRVAEIMGEATTKASVASDLLAASQQQAADAAADAAKETKGYTDELIYQINYLTRSQTAEQTALQDKIALKAATKAVADAVKTYGKNSNEARLARLNLTEAEKKSKDSAKVARDSVRDAGAAAGAAAVQYDKLVRAVEKANARLRQTPTAAVRIPGTQILLAAGGIIRRATSAIVGEAGPEVVIPLNDRMRAMQLMLESGLSSLVAPSFAFTGGGSLSPAFAGGGTSSRSVVIAEGAVQLNFPGGTSATAEDVRAIVKAGLKQLADQIARR